MTRIAKENSLILPGQTSLAEPLAVTTIPLLTCEVLDVKFGLETPSLRLDLDGRVSSSPFLVGVVVGHVDEVALDDLARLPPPLTWPVTRLMCANFSLACSFCMSSCSVLVVREFLAQGELLGESIPVFALQVGVHPGQELVRLRVALGPGLEEGASRELVPGSDGGFGLGLGNWAGHRQSCQEC